MRLEARRGITLIETLVVLALIAIAASVAVLNAPPARGEAKEEAERFAARLDAAFSTALVQGAPVRLEVDKGGYAFKVYDGDGWKAVVGEARLAARRPRDVDLSVLSTDPAFVNVAEKDKKDEPALALIDPLGGDGVTVAFESNGRRWIVAMDRLGAVKVTRDDR